jgi:hypothetical protein
VFLPSSQHQLSIFVSAAATVSTSKLAHRFKEQAKRSTTTKEADTNPSSSQVSSTPTDTQVSSTHTREAF